MRTGYTIDEALRIVSALMIKNLWGTESVIFSGISEDADYIRRCARAGRLTRIICFAS